MKSPVTGVWHEALIYYSTPAGSGLCPKTRCRREYTGFSCLFFLLPALQTNTSDAYVLGLFNEVQELLALRIKYQILTCSFSLGVVRSLVVILLNYPLCLNECMELLPPYTEVEKSRELRHRSKALCGRARHRQYQSRVLRDKNTQLLRVSRQCVHCQISLLMTLYGTPPS